MTVLVVVYSTKLSAVHMLERQITGGLLKIVANNVEGRGRGLSKVLLRHLPRRAEETHLKSG
jgi:hypothetical protein